MITINCKGRLVSFEKPVVMGIINTTPDSFYSSSRQATIDGALHSAEKMLEEGAHFLDIGGQSTRPGSERVVAEEELKRVLPIIQAIANRFPEALLSIDTFYALVATEAVATGAALVNDVSAGGISTLR